MPEEPQVEKFEDALTQLEKLVAQLERGDLSLEDSLTAFEQGIRLSKLCHERLDEAEKKIETLLDTQNNKK